MSRHGKDTVGSVFIEEGYTRIAFADKVKEVLCENLNITLEELEKNKNKYRDLIIQLAETTKKEEGDDIWVRKVNNTICELLDNNENIVISDVRQWYEVDYINSLKDKYKEVSLIMVVRPTSNGGVFDTDKNTSHGINFAMYNNYLNMIIMNEGSEQDLKNNIKEIYF